MAVRGVCFQLKKTVEELNDALATKEEISQRCRELDMQVSQGGACHHYRH